jgi:hypothetical protein
MNIDPIADLIDQIDEANEICAKCTTQTKHLQQLSCNHVVCMDCIISGIPVYDNTKCLVCQSVLTQSLDKIHADFFGSIVSKLSYYHNINIGDILWYYCGNNHNWLYTHENCLILEKSSEDSLSEIELNILIDGVNAPYTIDLDKMVQYPKNSSNKQRRIENFEFRSLSDLRKHNIGGVAGKLI